jgi:hypothetical protein
MSPAQAADEDVEVDCMDRLSFRLATFFFCTVSNPISCRFALSSILPTSSFSLVSINVLQGVPGKISDP